MNDKVDDVVKVKESPRPRLTSMSSDNSQSLSIADKREGSLSKEIPTLSHLDASGEAHMVSIAHKIPTRRSATATTVLCFSNSRTFDALSASRLKKGDAMATARIAGIQGAKKTADLIPLAHPSLNITGMSVKIEPFHGSEIPHFLVSTTPQPMYGGVLIKATVDCEGKTGVEMEAMTAASVAGLTMYDMLKGVDKGMVMTETRVVAKSGGKSGDWEWDYEKKEIVKIERKTQPSTKRSPHNQVTRGRPVTEEHRIFQVAPPEPGIGIRQKPSTPEEQNVLNGKVQRHIAKRQQEIDSGMLMRVSPDGTLTPISEEDMIPSEVASGSFRSDDSEVELPGQKNMPTGPASSVSVPEIPSTHTLGSTVPGLKKPSGEVILVARGPVSAADLAEARRRRLENMWGREGGS
jgi:molybdenum cofactor biosynthesis protein MoaC